MNFPQGRRMIVAINSIYRGVPAGHWIPWPVYYFGLLHEGSQAYVVDHKEPV